MEFLDSWLNRTEKCGGSHSNQAINAIKFYYEKVKGGERKITTM